MLGIQDLGLKVVFTSVQYSGAFGYRYVVCNRMGATTEYPTPGKNSF